jgi:hypothetical protein
MLLGYMANDVQIDLHSGGSFDYLLVMHKYKSGIRTRKTTDEISFRRPDDAGATY